MKASSSRAGVWEMALCAVMWSMGGVLIKQIPWNGMVISGLRSLIAALVILLYMAIKKLPFVVNRRTLFVGVSLCLTCTCFMLANKLTTAANAIVLQYTAPVFLLVYGVVFFKQKFRRGDYLAVIGTMVGITLFFFDSLDAGALWGNLLAIFAGACFAATMSGMDGVDASTRMSALSQGHLLGAIIGLPFLFVYGAELSVPSVGYILALGVLQLGIPYLLYGLATATCSPLACILLAALEPILNPVWVFLAVGEAPGSTALLGGVLVIVCVTAWCVWDHRAKAAEAAALRA